MPSKKKPRPLFEVPVEIGSTRESGWVYRSDDSPEEPHSQPQPLSSPGFDGSVVALSAQLFALAMATVATGFALSVTVTALPFTMSLRVFDSVANYRSS